MGTEIEGKVLVSLVKNKMKEKNQQEWEKRKKTNGNSRNLGTVAMPTWQNLSKSQHSSHAVTKTWNQLRSGHNSWRGNPPYYAITNKNMSNEKKAELTNAAKQARVCRLCDSGEDMNTKHVFCRCENVTLEAHRRSMIEKLKQVRAHAYRDDKRIEWYLNEEEWRDKRDPDKNIPSHLKPAVQEITHEFVCAIAPLTGRLWN